MAIVAIVSHYILPISPLLSLFCSTSTWHTFFSSCWPSSHTLDISVHNTFAVDRFLCIITFLYPVQSCTPPSSSPPAFWPSLQPQALPSVPCHHSNVLQLAAMLLKQQAVILFAATPTSRTLPRAKQCRIA
jgi:hypothetical protein